jgi:hypothetical protein
MSERVIAFDNIVGAEELTAKDNPFHLKVTRHNHGQYALTVSRKDPAGKKHALVHFWLKMRRSKP